MFGLNPISSAAISALTGQDRSASIAETAVAADQIVGSNTGFSSVSESVAATDTVSAFAIFATRIAEFGFAADAVLVAPSVFGASVTELASGLDNYNPAGSTYYASVTTSIQVFDSVIGAYLWNPIDDDQVPNWGGIDNAQTASWASITNTQASNWAQINTADTTLTGASFAETPYGVIPFGGETSGSGSVWGAVATPSTTTWTYIG